jgi:hypothetical protein
MGYMGLSNWIQSDGAADFRYTLQEVFKKNLKKGQKALTKAVRDLICKEIKDKGNCYNTDGGINIALVMEDEGSPAESFDDDGLGTPKFSNLLTKKEFALILKSLDSSIDETKKIDEWTDKENAFWHRDNYKRMKKSVTKKMKG